MPGEQALKPSVRATYDAQADQYEAFIRTSFSWLYIEKPAIDLYTSEFHQPETRVLEAGCGAGRVIEHLASKGINLSNIVGVDISARMLEYAKSALPGAKLLQSSLADLALRDGGFDLATSNMVFHHLDNKEASSALTEIHRNLKAGGTVFIVDTDPARIVGTDDPDSQNSWLFPRSPWGTTQVFFNRSVDDFVALAEKAGYKALAVDYLRASEEGRGVDFEKFIDYTERPARVAFKFQRK